MATDSAYNLRVRLVDQNGNPLELTTALSTDIPDRAERELGRVSLVNGSARRWVLVDLSSGTHTFDVPPLAIYASSDALVTLEDEVGTQNTFQLFIGQNPYSPKKIHSAGSSLSGVTLWGLF